MTILDDLEKGEDVDGCNWLPSLIRVARAADAYYKHTMTTAEGLVYATELRDALLELYPERLGP